MAFKKVNCSTKYLNIISHALMILMLKRVHKKGPNDLDPLQVTLL
jgi:hypothetical protein